MHQFVEVADAIGATTKKSLKLRLLGEYFKSLPIAEAALAARFFSGHAFAGYEDRSLGIGGANLWRVISDIAGKEGENLGITYRKHGDLGDTAEEVLRGTNRDKDFPLANVAMLFEELAAARGTGQK